MKGFGERVATLRHRLELTQEQLGRTLGVSGQAVSKWEQRGVVPDASLLPALATALRCSVDHLLGCDDLSGMEDLARRLRDRLQASPPEVRQDTMAAAFRIAFMGIEDAGGDPVARVVWKGAPSEGVAEVTAAGEAGWTLFVIGDMLRYHPDLRSTGAPEALAALSDAESWALLRTQLDGEKVRTETRRAAQADDALRSRLDRLIDAGLLALEHGGYTVTAVGMMWLAALSIAATPLGALHTLAGRGNPGD